MAHDHDNRITTKNISAAFWLNTVFALFEIAGGLYTNSVAILSDALHDLGDSLSLGAAWFFQRKSKQKRDKDFSYGYRRFSLLGAFINAVVLIVGSIFIVAEAVQRLFNPQQPFAEGMLVLAIVGVVVNATAMLRLKKGGSINERVVSLHFLEDVLGWVAVLIASVVMMFVNVPVLDPALSILIACYVLYNVYRNLGSALRIVLQGIPENVNEEAIRQKVLSIPGVCGVHDLHLWTLDGTYNILTTHVVVREPLSSEHMTGIKNELRLGLKHLNLQHLTIEMELEGEDCRVKLYNG